MKKNGFTLIELLAVIVILGVILVIAIPSISAAILNSRKKAYVATANELVDGVRMAILNDASLLPEGTTPKYFNISDIKIEKGSKTTSSFHKNYTASSYIRVVYDETTDEYIYSVCLVDEAGNGIGEVNNNPINIKDIEVSHISIGGATCTLNGTGGGGTGGGSGGDDNGNGDDGETIVEGSSSDWIVSDEPNATGGYTLLGFNGNIAECDYTRTCINIGVEKNFYTNDDINQLLLAWGTTNRDAYTINIPNEVDGKKIEELGEGLFKAAPIELMSGGANPNEITIPYMLIKKVVIPEGIVKINGAYNNGAFMLNLSLMEVSFPSTLKTIGDYAFLFNFRQDLTIPANIETIGDYAYLHNPINSLIFEGATDGTSHLKTIGTGAFGNIYINSLVIPQSVEIIGASAFLRFSTYDPVDALTSLIFAGTEDGTSQLTNIGEKAFMNNNLSTVVIPNSVVTIGKQAFYKDTSEYSFNPWVSITVKKASSAGMTLGNNWNGGANVIWSGN